MARLHKKRHLYTLQTHCYFLQDGTFHHIGEHHLQRYCTEFDFRWNYRSAEGYDDMDRADMILKGIQGKRLTYRRPHEARA